MKLFAVAGELAGAEQMDIELPAGATVGDLRRAIVERTPDLAPVLAGAMIAVNMDYAADAHVLAEGDEAAVIPPVSGGD
jgi:molybdopterin converting factor subunit 1